MSDDNRNGDGGGTIYPFRPRGGAPPGLPPVPGAPPPAPPATPPTDPDDTPNDTDPDDDGGAAALPARCRRSAADSLAVLSPSLPPAPGAGQAQVALRTQGVDAPEDEEDAEAPGLGVLSLAATLAVALAALRGTATAVQDWRQRRLEREAENAPLREARLKHQLALEEAAAKHGVAMQSIGDKAVQQRAKQAPSSQDFGRKALGGGRGSTGGGGRGSSGSSGSGGGRGSGTSGKTGGGKSGAKSGGGSDRTTGLGSTGTGRHGAKTNTGSGGRSGKGGSLSSGGGRGPGSSGKNTGPKGSGGSAGSSGRGSGAKGSGGASGASGRGIKAPSNGRSGSSKHSPALERAKGRNDRAAARLERRGAAKDARLDTRRKNRDRAQDRKQAAQDARRQAKADRTQAKRDQRAVEKAARTSLGQAVTDEAGRRLKKRRKHLAPPVLSPVKPDKPKKKDKGGKGGAGTDGLKADLNKSKVDLTKRPKTGPGAAPPKVDLNKKQKPSGGGKTGPAAGGTAPKVDLNKKPKPGKNGGTGGRTAAGGSKPSAKAPKAPAGGAGRTTLGQAVTDEAARRLKKRRKKPPRPVLSKAQQRKPKNNKNSKGKGGAGGTGPKVNLRKTRAKRARRSAPDAAFARAKAQFDERLRWMRQRKTRRTDQEQTSTPGAGWAFWTPPGQETPRQERRSAYDSMRATDPRQEETWTAEQIFPTGYAASARAALTAGGGRDAPAPSGPPSTTITKEAPVDTSASAPSAALSLPAAEMSAEHATEVTLDDVTEFLNGVVARAFEGHDECIVLATEARELQYALDELAVVLATRNNIIGTLTSRAMHKLAESMEVLARKADEMQIESLNAAELNEEGRDEMEAAYRPLTQATADAGLRTPSARVHNEN